MKNQEKISSVYFKPSRDKKSAHVVVYYTCADGRYKEYSNVHVQNVSKKKKPEWSRLTDEQDSMIDKIKSNIKAAAQELQRDEIEVTVEALRAKRREIKEGNAAKKIINPKECAELLPFLRNLPDKFQLIPKGKRAGQPKSAQTLRRYATLEMHLSVYENYLRYKKEHQPELCTPEEQVRRVPIALPDVDLCFMQDFDMFLQKKTELPSEINTYRYADVNLEPNSRHAVVKCLKAILNHLRLNGYWIGTAVNHTFVDDQKFTEYTGSRERTYYQHHFTVDEIRAIYALRKSSAILKKANAAEWLRMIDVIVFGFHVGQRYADLVSWDEDNFIDDDGIIFLKLTQQKTGKRVSIPVMDEAEEIVRRHKRKPFYMDNSIGAPVSNPKLNQWIKDLAKEAGISQKVQVYEDSKLKDKAPKHELVHVHTLRHSFVRYHLAQGYTVSEIIAMSGHSEKELSTYSDKDIHNNAKLAAQRRLKNNSPLRIVKKRA